MAAFTVTTGTLAEIVGSPYVTTGNAPYTLAAVSTKFLYAGIPSSGGVINRVLNRPVAGSVTGGIMLMPISNHTLGTPQMFASGGDYDPIAVTPNGNFLYALDITKNQNQLVAFSIDSSKGTLTAINQTPFTVGPDPFNVVIDPQGKYVFVANCHCRTNPDNQGSVSVLSIDSSTGALTQVGSPISLGSGAQPVAMAVSPDNKFLFIASLDDKVYVKSVTNGVLSDAATSPSVSLPPGSMPVSIAVSIDGGNSVYTGNAGTRDVSFFLNCTQTPLPPVATGSTTGCPTDNSVPLVLQTAGGASIGGAVGVIVPDPTSTPASTVGSVTFPAIGVGHYLYITDYDHGTISVLAVTSSTTCTSTSCPTTPGTLFQAGSAVNTGGTSPFGLAFSH
jgi:hypothetical protein